MRCHHTNGLSASTPLSRRPTVSYARGSVGRDGRGHARLVGIAQGRIRVEDLALLLEALRMSQPKISRHLAYLRRAGVVATRRDGKWMHYRIVEPPDERAARVLGEVRRWLTEDSEMQRDRARLIKVCCAPTLPVRLRNAPRPSVTLA